MWLASSQGLENVCPQTWQAVSLRFVSFPRAGAAAAAAAGAAAGAAGAARGPADLLLTAMGAFTESSLKYFGFGALTRGLRVADRRLVAIAVPPAAGFALAGAEDPAARSRTLGLGGGFAALTTNCPHRPFKWFPSSHGRLKTAPHASQERAEPLGGLIVGAEPPPPAASSDAAAGFGWGSAATRASQRTRSAAALRPVLKECAFTFQRPSPSRATSCFSSSSSSGVKSDGLAAASCALPAAGRSA